MSNGNTLLTGQDRTVNNPTGGFITMAEKDILSNQKLILKNQSTILRNQDTIKKNQVAIKDNQKDIKKNQESLNVILKNQERIIALLQK